MAGRTRGRRARQRARPASPVLDRDTGGHSHSSGGRQSDRLHYWTTRGNSTQEHTTDEVPQEDHPRDRRCRRRARAGGGVSTTPRRLLNHDDERDGGGYRAECREHGHVHGHIGTVEGQRREPRRGGRRTTYDSTDATITLKDGASTTTSDTGVSVDGDTVTITAPGTYVLTGTLTDGTVVVPAMPKVRSGSFSTTPPSPTALAPPSTSKPPTKPWSSSRTARPTRSPTARDTTPPPRTPQRRPLLDGRPHHRWNGSLTVTGNTDDGIAGAKMVSSSSMERSR